jgi:hypothetical protein
VAARPAEPAKPALPAQPTEARTEPGSRVEARGKSARGKQQKKSGPRPKLKDLLGFSDFDSRAARVEEAAEVATPVESAPEAMPEPGPKWRRSRRRGTRYDDGLPVEDEEIANGDARLMQNSPVLAWSASRSTGAATTEFSTPDAVAVATLATGSAFPRACGRPSARLLDVARRLEEGALGALRGHGHRRHAVPDLAKRLLPILLPWLERAA